MKIKGVFWHHFVGTDRNPKASTKHHTAEIVDVAHKRRWPGFTSKVYKNKRGEFYHVGYNRVIEVSNLRIVKTRAFGEETAAAIGFNRGYIHVAFSGNYDWGADKWEKETEKLICEGWEEIKAEFPYLRIGQNWPHRKVARKSCFGNSLPDNHVQITLATHEVLHNKKPVPEISKEMKMKYYETIIMLMKQTITLLIARNKRYSFKQK